MEHYKAILDVLMLLRDHEFGVSEQDARFMFFWAQSVVRDELRNRQRAVSLLYSDFVEVCSPRILCVLSTSSLQLAKPQRPLLAATQQYCCVAASKGR